MKKVKSAILAAAFTFLLLLLGQTEAAAQPNQAQMKARLTTPGVVSVVINGSGSRDWSKTYSKYVWTMYFTIKRKTAQPGVFVTVKGYSYYDIVGGKFIFWRDFYSENSYDGQKPPTIAEINETIQKLPAQDFAQHLQVGEYESLRLAPNPDWQWHTMNSISFTVIGVYRIHYSGKGYGSEAYYTEPTGKSAIDRVETHLRFRLYRDETTIPWRAVGVSDRIPGDASRKTLREIRKLLDRQLIPWAQGGSIAGPTRPPVLTQ